MTARGVLGASPRRGKPGGDGDPRHRQALPSGKALRDTNPCRRLGPAVLAGFLSPARPGLGLNLLLLARRRGAPTGPLWAWGRAAGMALQALPALGLFLASHDLRGWDLPWLPQALCACLCVRDHAHACPSVHARSRACMLACTCVDVHVFVCAHVRGHACVHADGCTDRRSRDPEAGVFL